MFSVSSQANVVVSTMTRMGHTLSACESLTAGLFCATVANISGASAVLTGGLVTYATPLKAVIGGVPQDVLATNGPVSEVTVRHMAEHVKKTCLSDWGISLSGVAGPDMQDGHPVGEVWIGLARPDNSISAYLAGDLLTEAPQSVHRLLIGDRATIRHTAVSAALGLLIRELSSYST